MKVYSLRSWRPLHRLRGPPPPLWRGRLEVRSVPLRGYGFEILGKEISTMKNVVSVPLRGYGFEIGFHAKEQSRSNDVSGPLRGYGFEI